MIGYLIAIQAVAVGGFRLDPRRRHFEECSPTAPPALASETWAPHALATTFSIRHNVLVSRIPTMEVVGVYPVHGVESCCLIEALVYGASSKPDFGAISQPAWGVERSDWQVPHDEKLLDGSGTMAVTDLFLASPPKWPSVARIAFFFHDLDNDRPLTTPFGEVGLPAPTSRPDRLDWYDYEPPC